MINKICPNCNQSLPISNFGGCKRDGVQSFCKKCKTIKAKEYYEKNPQKVLRRNNKYRRTIRGILVSRFADMKRRCENPNHRAYKDYGGRGIKCLFESSDDFVTYVVNKLQVDPYGLEIDRIDNDGHYEPGNLRLIPHVENMSNRRKKCQK